MQYRQVKHKYKKLKLPLLFVLSLAMFFAALWTAAAYFGNSGEKKSFSYAPVPAKTRDLRASAGNGLKMPTSTIPKWSLLGYKQGYIKELAEGDVVFQVTQKEDVYPKIIQAEVNPPDVHVGFKQKLTVLVQDPSPITSVEAKIETDHKTITVPLRLASQSADMEILPRKYVLNSKSELVSFEKAETRFNTAYAAVELPVLKYEGEWTVEDTHDTTYRTAFVVKDAAGRENSTVVAWSDACAIPATGAWSLSYNAGACSIGDYYTNWPDGVENGNANINAYTLTVMSTFVFNSGYSLLVSGTGQIALAASNYGGGQIRKTNLWAQDQDSDTWPRESGQYATYWVAQDAQPLGYIRRGSKSALDCDDRDASIFPDSTSCVDAPIDMNCDGNITNCTGDGCYVQYAGCFGFAWQNGPPGCGVWDYGNACDWYWNGYQNVCTSLVVGGGGTTEYCQ